MRCGCGDDMTFAKIFPGSLPRFAASWSLGEKLAAVCPGKGGVYRVHTRVRVMLVGDSPRAYFC
jgi:hypothetical protein